MKAPKISVNGRFYKVSSIKYFNNYISFVNYYKDGWITAVFYDKTSKQWTDEKSKKMKVRLFF